tara:strand:+ start:1441 stop:2130 length:690 start_codon:yes stop_codon:yes gene_type:complete
MARPLIGITTSLTETSQTLQRRYVDAIEQTGGAPVIVAQTADPTAQRPLLEVLDGLVITGGPGITEGLVGQLPDDLPAVDLHRWKSDCVAFELLREKRRPMLGICYGMQFINARLGGTLFADVQAQLGVGAHSPKRTQGVNIMHDVSVETGSLLADLVESSSIPANSFHLQAVENVGEGLRVNARAADGLIEGIEEEGGRLLGVQFHPEAMLGSAWDSLFAHLVRQASL